MIKCCVLIYGHSELICQSDLSLTGTKERKKAFFLASGNGCYAIILLGMHKHDAFQNNKEFKDVFAMNNTFLKMYVFHIFFYYSSIRRRREALETEVR